MMTGTAPQVGIIMGSQSDWDTMRAAAEVLADLDIAHEVRIVSAHRTPDRLVDYAKGAAGRGLQVIIAGAGGAAHLPGMAASMTALPVLGVPVTSAALNGMDSLLSIVQMPGGVPVGTLAIGKAGATNAGLLAASILALSDPSLAARRAAWRQARTDAVGDVPQCRPCPRDRQSALSGVASWGACWPWRQRNLATVSMSSTRIPNAALGRLQQS
jgi:5-(carboxyamino)imidazole ribonucleotide mutase